MPGDAEVCRNTSYGDYILRTGKGIIGQYELVFGALFYERFRGRKCIVDIGPGRCWFPKQNPDAIMAVDNSPELIQHFSAQGIDIRLGNAYDLGLPEDHVDGVFCCWVFEHLEDPLRSMREIYRVMQPGAYGLIVVPTPHNMVDFYDDYTHVRPYTHHSLGQLAEDSGFRRHHESYLPFGRGSIQVLKFFGSSASLSYLKFCDRTVRKLGLVNRNNAVLEFWKD